MINNNIKLDKTDKKIKIKIAISLVIITIFSICYHLKSEYYKKLTSTENIAKKEMFLHRGKAVFLQEQGKNIDKYMKIWKSLEENGEDFKGLKMTLAQKVLQDLKKKYYFTDIKIQLSKPIITRHKSNLMGIESSNITLQISAHTDVHILQFIKDLKEKLSGRIIVRNCKIRLHRDMQTKTFKELYDKNITVVSAKIELNWSALKEL